MELVAFLEWHSARLERSARGLSKRKSVDVEDALQLILVAAADLVSDVYIDLDGRYVHLRDSPDLYLAVDPRSVSFGKYVTQAAYRDVSNYLRGKQREFEEEISSTPFVEPILLTEPGIVVSDLLGALLRFGESHGPDRLGVLVDVLANEGLADFTTETFELWQSEVSRQPRGRSRERIPYDFIFKTHGLTSKQGRSFLSEAVEFLQTNGFNRRAA